MGPTTTESRLNRIPGWRRLRGWKRSLLTSFCLLGGFIPVDDESMAEPLPREVRA